MFGKYTLLLVGLLALTTLALVQSRRGMAEPEPPGSLIDIDTELGKEKEEVPEESGSGKDGDDEDDEDLEKSSGSGSGAYGTGIDEKPTTTKTLTPCQNLHEASKHLLGNYVPKCDENGDYGPMQCRGHASTGRCWCSDKNGAEIPGTAVDPPRELNCETGKNLSPCLFKLVFYIRNQRMGGYRPRCKINGDFEDQQCMGSVCFCVDANGGELPSSKHRIDQIDMCAAKPTEEPLIIPEVGVTTRENPVKNVKPVPTKSEGPGYTIASKPPNVNVKPPTPIDEGEEEGETESPNKTGEQSDDIDPTKQQNVQSAHIMTQPGLLAAIIGGAVVGLLCAILLVMFIVYRMRKKDEGRYALDEPRKKSTYSPINQTDKEYYA